MHAAGKIPTSGRYFKPGDIIIYVTLVAILALGVALTADTSSTSPLVAVITSNGEEICRLDLEKVEAPYEFTVPYGEDHYNTVRVETGRIRVVEASCPDQIDVKQGWISRPHQSIICLPNRLFIRILPLPDRMDEIDGITF